MPTPLLDRLLEFALDHPTWGAKSHATELVREKVAPRVTTDLVAEIAAILSGAEFLRRLTVARADEAQSVVQRFKRRAHVFARRMEELAEQDADQRVAFQATKDILDRAGTAPAQKIVNTPGEYRKILDEFADTPAPEGAAGEGSE